MRSFEERRSPSASRWGGLLTSLVIVLAACGPGAGERQSAASGAGPEVGTSQQAAISIIETFNTGFVEIDACPNTFLGETPGCIPEGTSTPLWAGDANVFGPLNTASNGDDLDLLVKTDNKATTGDMASPSLSYSFPPDSSPTFIDWNDLASGDLRANHVLTDPIAAADTSAFPQSNSCVDSATVLGKMDITAVTVSNNTEYAYFGVQRREQTGDAGYMWLFTRNIPLTAATADCPAPKYELRYQLRRGDVMFRGHFVSDTTSRLLYVYRVGGDDPDYALPATLTVGNLGPYSKVCPDDPVVEANCYIEMPAKAAINWENGLWTENAAYVAGAATNSSIAGVGAVGLNGVGAYIAKGQTYVIHNTKPTPDYTWECKDDAGCMLPYVFAEVAVPISVFVGTGPTCETKFYGSVITRPSGNTASPDMKDLAGPYQFKFLENKLTAAVAGACDFGFWYGLTSFSGVSGGSITPEHCTWTIDKGTASEITLTADTNCSIVTTSTLWKYTAGSTFTTGSHTVDLHAEDAAGCKADATQLSVKVWKPIDATASMDPYCASPVKFDYAGTVKDGSDAGYEVQWTFDDGTNTVATKTDLSGTISSGLTAKTKYNGTFVATDKRTDAKKADGTADSCTVTKTADATPYAPLAIAIELTTTVPACTSPETFTSDAVTFEAVGDTATGGSGSYTYTWRTGTATTDPLASCANTSGITCTYDPSDSLFCAAKNFALHVADQDATTECPAVVSKLGSYSKVTTLTAGVAP